MIEKNNPLTVVKSNELIAACFRLSLNETRLLYYAIACNNPMENEHGWQNYYEIKVSDIADMFKIKQENVYRDMLAACNAFFERKFTMIDQNNIKHKGRFIDLISYQEKKGFLAIKFSESIKPYLYELKGNFTTYKLQQIALFTSPNSTRFYEFSVMELKRSKKNVAEFTIPITQLRELLEMNDKYKRFNQFRERVIDKSIEDINQFSDLTLSVNVIKDGKTPTDIAFKVKYKPKSNKTPKVNTTPSPTQSKKGSNALADLKKNMAKH